MKVEVITVKNKRKKIEIPDKVLDLKLNKDLISQVYRGQVLNQNQPRATKTRKERSGGGRKPWRQKGTGRARHGSIRSPLWRKGGVVFGPKREQNFKKSVNKKMNRKATASLLSDRYQKKKLIIISTLPRSRKTKSWQSYLAKLPIEKAGKILFVIDQKNLAKSRFGRNIPFLKIVGDNRLSLKEIINSDIVIFTENAAKKIFTNLAKR